MGCNSTPNITKTFIIEPLSTTGNTSVLSACTALYTNNIILCSGDTLNVFGGVSATTFYGDGSNLTGISFTGNTSGDCITDLYISNLYGCSPITLHDDIIPNNDNEINLGTSIKRFRDINTNSGTSSVWTSVNKVITPNLDLGLDSSGNTRIITANNSIIQDDTLFGGSY
jgi:hypothetical protein